MTRALAAPASCAWTAAVFLLAAGCGPSATAPVGQASSGATPQTPPPDAGTVAAGDAGDAGSASGPAAPSLPATPIPASPVAGAPFEGVVWSPGGRWLGGFCVVNCPASKGAASSSRAPLHVLDRRAGTLHRSLAMAPSPDGGGASAAFSPDDAFVATMHQSDRVRVIRVEDGKTLRDQRVVAAYDNLWFSPDSARLVLGSALGGWALLGLPKGDVVRAEALSNPYAVAAPMGLAWSPEGDRFIVTRDGSELRDGRTGARVAEVPGGGSAADVLVTFRRGGAAILAACDGRVQAVRAAPFAIDVLRSPTTEGPCRLVASADAGAVYRASDAGVDVFEVASRSSRTLPSPGSPGGPLLPSPDGKWLAQVRTRPAPADRGGGRATVHVFHLGTPADPILLEGDEVIGWSANGDLYLTASGELRAWSPATRADVLRAVFESPALSHRLSPDGRFVASADGQLVLTRTSDRSTLRVSIDDVNGAPRMTPEPAEIASFLR